jgi:hypothetical protein
MSVWFCRVKLLPDGSFDFLYAFIEESDAAKFIVWLPLMQI